MFSPSDCSNRSLTYDRTNKSRRRSIDAFASTDGEGQILTNMRDALSNYGSNLSNTISSSRQNKPPSFAAQNSLQPKFIGDGHLHSRNETCSTNPLFFSSKENATPNMINASMTSLPNFTQGPSVGHHQASIESSAQNINETFNHLDRALNHQTHWVNIQEVVRSSLRDVVSLCAGQQEMLNLMNNTIQSNKFEYDQKLSQKADVQDVSNAISEVIMTVDTRKDVESIKLSIDKNEADVKNKHKQKVASLIDGFRQEMKQLFERLQTLENSSRKSKDRMENVKKTQISFDSKLTKIYRDIEMLQTNVERKNIFEAARTPSTDRMTSKEGGPAYKNLSTKVQELEQHLGYKTEISEVQELIQTLELKFEDAFSNIHEQLMRKASAEDLQYCKRDIGYKTDRDELDSFKTDMHDRLASIKGNGNENDKYIETLGKNIEARVEQRLAEWKSKVNTHLQRADNQIEDSFRSLGSRIQQELGEHSEIIDNIIGKQIEKSRIDMEEKIQMLLIQTRKEDIDDISELVKASQQQVTEQMINLQEKFKMEILETKACLEDKVKVNEVKDAIKQLSEMYSAKLEKAKEGLKQRQDQEFDLRLDHMNKQIKDQIGGMKDSVQLYDAFKTRMEQSLEHSAQAVLAMQEVLHKFKLSIEERPHKGEVLKLIESRAHSEEFFEDIQNITSNMSRIVNQMQEQKVEQLRINKDFQKSVSTGRWVFSRPDLVNLAECISWDAESVNSDIELFRWHKTNTIEGSSIVVDKPGLYSVNIALFVNIAASTLAQPPQNRDLNASSTLSLNITNVDDHSPNKSRNNFGHFGAGLTQDNCSPISGCLYVNGQKVLDMIENTVSKPDPSKSMNASVNVSKSQTLNLGGHMVSLQTQQVIRLNAAARLQIAFSSPYYHNSSSLPIEIDGGIANYHAKQYKVAVVEGCFAIQKI